MPTEASLRNLVVSPAVRAENVAKMKATRRRQAEEGYRGLLARMAELEETREEKLSNVEIARILNVSKDMVGRAKKWKADGGV